MSEQRIQAVYRVPGGPGEADRLARAIAYEQTVELPDALITAPEIVANVVGAVTAVAPDPEIEGTSRVTIDYAAALASGQIPQLLNLLFGNVSIYPGVRLLDIRLPEEFLAAAGTSSRTIRTSSTATSKPSSTASRPVTGRSPTPTRRRAGAASTCPTWRRQPIAWSATSSMPAGWAPPACWRAR
jgi:ribulose 1,5-bisphosphate carboxylase large subunit-like protein